MSYNDSRSPEDKFEKENMFTSSFWMPKSQTRVAAFQRPTVVQLSGITLRRYRYGSCGLQTSPIIDKNPAALSALVGLFSAIYC